MTPISHDAAGRRGIYRADRTVDGVQGLDAIVEDRDWPSSRPVVDHEALVVRVWIDKGRVLGKIQHAPDCRFCRPVSAYDAARRAADALGLVAGARGYTVVRDLGEIVAEASAEIGATRTVIRVDGQSVKIVEQTVRSREWYSGSDESGRVRAGWERVWTTTHSRRVTAEDFPDPVVREAFTRWDAASRAYWGR